MGEPRVPGEHEIVSSAFCLVLNCWNVLCSGSDSKLDPVQELISVAAFSAERMLDPSIGPMGTVHTGADKWQEAASHHESVMQPSRTSLWKHSVPVLVSLGSYMTAVQDTEV